jgi:4-nitrophenyl phosphatase
VFRGGVIFDLDGVLWRGSLAIDGAADAVRRLREGGLWTGFCTNNSTKHRSAVAAQLEAIGIPAELDEVLTAGRLAASILAERRPGQPVLCVGEEGLVRELAEARVTLTDDPDAAAVVLMGWDRAINFDKYRRAHRAIVRGAHFMTTNPDLTFPEEDGGSAPGCGGLSAVLVASTGVRPECHGKPQPTLFEGFAEAWGLGAEGIAAVGDRLDTDIAAANAFGCLSVLTLTGVTTRDDAEAVEPPARPDEIIDSVADLPALLVSP